MAKKRFRKLRKSDLVGQRFERDASIVNIDEDAGTLYLMHVEGFLENGDHILFNGEIRLPLKDFEIEATVKCQVCRQNEQGWSWQPDLESFYLPGNHIRGFKTIKVCETCRENIKAGEEVHYTYKGQEYIVNEANQ